MKTFKELGLSNDLLEIIEQEGFSEPSEIQEQAIPLALAKQDIIGGSSTGSGKTLAFASAIVQNINPNKNVQALVLTPTRELADQVASAIKKFSNNKRLRTYAIYGGVDINAQIRNIPQADIIVGTPGRILDHMKRRTLDLGNIKILVLDEVDRMLDMGFLKDVDRIITQCPKERQTMLFSATISSDLDYLAKQYTRNPKEISVKSYVDSSKLKQVYYDVQPYEKFSLLVHLLEKEKSDLVMIFCSTRRNVDFLVQNLQKININAQAIHGGLAQNKRTKILEEFHAKGTSILVCTDVAARGLDINSVSHIYNYDLPKDSKEYVHRIGRTARAGKEGKAINIVANRDYENFNKISEDKSLKIEHEETPEFKTIRIEMDTGRRDHSRGNDSGQRRSSGRNFSRGNNSGQRRSSGRNFSRGSNSGQRRDSRGNDSEQRNESGRRYNNRPNYNRARR